MLKFAFDVKLLSKGPCVYEAEIRFDDPSTQQLYPDVELKDISLDISILKAISLFANPSDPDAFFDMKHIYVDLLPNDIFIFATNGYALLGYRLNNYDAISTPLTIMIPAEMIQRIKHKNGIINIKALAFPREYTIHPNVWKAIPKEFSGEPAQFDPALLYLFAKASQLLHKSSRDYPKPFMYYNGPNNPALVVFPNNENMFGLITPLKLEQPSIPKWIEDHLGEDRGDGR